MRINKYLAESGVASRRAADKLIEEGRVKINGKVAKNGDNAEPYTDVVTVDGNVVSTVKSYEYYMMNKPKGYLTTVKDDRGRKTVMDLLPKNIKRLFPIGRLDYDSEGLLIFTNDGFLAYKLTHPKNEVPKTYLVKINSTIDDLTLNKLRSGVYIDGVKTKKCKIMVTEKGKSFTKLHITITEGKNRQVRKMFDSVKKPVEFLKRIKIGNLRLSGLNRGEVRKLYPEEIEYLLNI